MSTQTLTPVNGHTPDDFKQAVHQDERTSIGYNAAIALYGSGWWKNKTHREIAGFQMSTRELCLPFSDFHEAIEKELGRPVFTHEFGLNFQGLLDELNGTKAPATISEIMDQIPKDKAVIVVSV